MSHLTFGLNDISIVDLNLFSADYDNSDGPNNQSNLNTMAYTEVIQPLV